MTTTTPIPTSLAAACAAHDRHRLDVLDVLLDEAAPTAVRELLGAALDLCASLRADRDELRAVSNALSDESSKRDAQLAAARQVIDEERATVARLTARVAELEARPVLTVERLDDALQPVLFGTGNRAKIASAAMAKLGPVTLPAQDRAEELTPTAAPDRSLVLVAASLLRDIVGNAGLAEGGEIGPRASDCMDMVRRLESTPTAAPGLVAAVSVEELIGVYGSAYNECSCSDGRFDDPSCCNKAAIRAVLARLSATTIAPVDPEAVARAYHASEALPDVPSWTEVSSFGRHYAIAAMRATLTAHGIPVTPEVVK